MFTAYGAGVIVGPYLAASLMRVIGTVPYEIKNAAGEIAQKFFTVGEYRTAFIAAGIACLIAVALVTQLKPARGK
jgi:hypothetical protein